MSFFLRGLSTIDNTYMKQKVGTKNSDDFFFQ